MNTAEHEPAPSAIDPGAKALAYALQILGLPADPAQLAHQSGKRELSGKHPAEAAD